MSSAPLLVTTKTPIEHYDYGQELPVDVWLIVFGYTAKFADGSTSNLSNTCRRLRSVINSLQGLKIVAGSARFSLQSCIDEYLASKVVKEIGTEETIVKEEVIKKAIVEKYHASKGMKEADDKTRFFLSSFALRTMETPVDSEPSNPPHEVLMLIRGVMTRVWKQIASLPFTTKEFRLGDDLARDRINNKLMRFYACHKDFVEDTEYSTNVFYRLFWNLFASNYGPSWLPKKLSGSEERIVLSESELIKNESLTNDQKRLVTYLFDLYRFNKATLAAKSNDGKRDIFCADAASNSNNNNNNKRNHGPIALACKPGRADSKQQRTERVKKTLRLLDAFHKETNEKDFVDNHTDLIACMSVSIEESEAGIDSNDSKMSECERITSRCLLRSDEGKTSQRSSNLSLVIKGVSSVFKLLMRLQRAPPSVTLLPDSCGCFYRSVFELKVYDTYKKVKTEGLASFVSYFEAVYLKWHAERRQVWHLLYPDPGLGLTFGGERRRGGDDQLDPAENSKKNKKKKSEDYQHNKRFNTELYRRMMEETRFPLKGYLDLDTREDKGVRKRGSPNGGEESDRDTMFITTLPDDRCFDYMNSILVPRYVNDTWGSFLFVNNNNNNNNNNNGGDTKHPETTKKRKGRGGERKKARELEETVEKLGLREFPSFRVIRVQARSSELHEEHLLNQKESTNLARRGDSVFVFSLLSRDETSSSHFPVGVFAKSGPHTELLFARGQFGAWRKCASMTSPLPPSSSSSRGATPTAERLIQFFEAFSANPREVRRALCHVSQSCIACNKRLKCKNVSSLDPVYHEKCLENQQKLLHNAKEMAQENPPCKPTAKQNKKQRII